MKILIQGKSSICGIILVNAVQCLLAILSIIVDPPIVKENIKPGESIILGCMPYQERMGRALHLTMLLYLVVLVVISTTYSFKARKIPENYNEARCIVFSLYILILSWVVYYPVHFVLDGWYVAIVSNASTLLSSYGLLICIFFPKLYIIFLHPEQNTLEYARAQITKHNMHRASVGLTLTAAKFEPISNIDKSITLTPELCSEVQDTSRNHVMPLPPGLQDN
jgi:metabotropic glutamate receptor 6/7/8